MRPRRTHAALAAVLLVVTACTSTRAADTPPDGTPAEPAPAAPSQAGPTYPAYAALGDSYTSGPLIPETEFARGCLRSSVNYPSLLAEALQVETLDDRSCIGARTTDLAAGQRLLGEPLPPQLGALGPETDLVTVGIGGNDLDLFTALAAGAVPDDLEAATRRTGLNLEQALREARSRAPEATVVLVGYPRLVEPGETCPDRLPLTAEAVDAAARGQLLLRDAMRQAARRAGALFADLYAASRNHDVCSASPWVNGVRTERGKAAAYHPLAEGMRAAADLVVETLHAADAGSTAPGRGSASAR